MTEKGRRGCSLICTEAWSHAAAHAGGRWVLARARGGGACGLGSFTGTHGSIVRGDESARGRLARSDYA
jgi:hypothetical protein